MPTPSDDLQLLRLLLREQRLDVATLQQLRDLPHLDEALLGRGLLRPHELQAFRAALTRGAAPGLGEVGEYRLVERLGQGGMGAVFLGEHLETGARRAIKVMSGFDPNLLERFRREGQAQAATDEHPNVLKVYGAGHSGRKHYLVMDLAPGGDLERRLAEGPFAPERAVEIVAQLADGLQHVHERGILHRDLKPSNVLFDAAGTPLLVDFGLARLVDAETLTRTHALLGTPAYMAPEQIRGAHEHADARSDVYGLGAILYECLTGQYLFGEAVGLQVLVHVMHSEPEAPSVVNPEVPAWLDGVCLRALAKDPAERFQTAAELAAALRAGEHGYAPRRRHPRRLRLALAAAVLLASAAAVLSKARDDSLVAGAEEEIAQLHTEIHAGTHGTGRLADDAELAAALRDRLEALERSTQGQPTPTTALARAEQDLLVWEGLIELARGDDPTARDRARGLDSLSRRHAGLAATPLAALFSACLNAQRDPARALDALTSSRLDRPELRAWIREAQLRLCRDAIEAGDYPRSLELARAVRTLSDAPLRLREACFASCRKAIRLWLGRIAAVEANKKVGGAATFVDLLRCAYLLRPAAGLTGAELDSLLAHATAPRRRVIGLGPVLAELEPKALRVQLQVAQHWLTLDGLLKIDRRQLARLYRPSIERAYALAPTDSQRAELGSKLCEVLRLTGRSRRCIQVAGELLADAKLDRRLRARILSTRSDAHRQLGQLRAALKDADASLASSYDAITHYRRARALLQSGRARYREARDAAMIVVRRIDPRRAELSTDEREAFRYSILVVWRTCVTLHDGYDLADEAISTLLGPRAPTAYAGWLIRRAHARLRHKPSRLEDAITDLAEATRRMRRNRALATLLPRAKKVLEALRDPREKQRRRKLWKLCAELGKRRKRGELLP